MSNRHIKLRMYFIVLIAILFFIGCGTIMTTGLDPVIKNNEGLLPGEEKDWKAIPWVYGGTLFDYKCLWHPEVRETNNMELFCLVDLPVEYCSGYAIIAGYNPSANFQ